MSKKLDPVPKVTIRPSKGFEEIYGEYVDSEEYKDLVRREFEKAKGIEQYELQSFLEQENSRLSRLEIFLTKKIFLMLNFSQSEKLILKQIERKKLVLEKLTFEYKKTNSPIQKNLTSFFNSHFS